MEHMDIEKGIQLYDRGYAALTWSHGTEYESHEGKTGSGSGVMGIVKADGYGHGAVPVAKTIEPYVSGYGVATIDEALILRRHGIRKPILVLGVPLG